MTAGFEVFMLYQQYRKDTNFYNLQNVKHSRKHILEISLGTSLLEEIGKANGKI